MSAAAEQARPPWLAHKFLRWALPSGLAREAVLGDFSEDYGELRRVSTWHARAWYWREAAGVGSRALMARFRRRMRGEAATDSNAFLAGGASGHGHDPGRPPRWKRMAFRFETAITQDIPYGVRNLLKAPGFTAVAVLSLAFGIAPLAAIGGFVNAMFFRPLQHVEQQDRLVSIFHGQGGPASWPDLQDAGEQIEGLVDVAAMNTTDGYNFTVGETTRSMMGGEVSANYFDVMGVSIPLGRAFAVDEMGPAADKVVLVSHGFWRSHFDSSPEVLGEVMRIDGADYRVIGVTPEGLLSPEMPVEPDVYVPLKPVDMTQRGRRGLYGIGRLADGATLDDVRAQAVVVTERLRAAYPRYWGDREGVDHIAVYPLGSLRLRPGQEAQIAGIVLLIGLLGALVLATACANLGNLLLARGWQRHGEIAVRLAMGADRTTLVVMLLAESVVLGCVGGALGGLAAHWLTRALQTGVIGPGVRLDFTVDMRVLAFTALVSITTGVLFGLVPALRSSRPQLSAALKGEQAATGRGRVFSFRNFMVAGQVAASLALLVSAGVLLRSLHVLRNIDPGFDPGGVVTVRLDLTQGNYSEVEAQQFFDQLVERVERAPGVTSAALAVLLPLNGSIWRTTIDPEGFEAPDDEVLVSDVNLVSGAYFDVIGMPVLRGRSFTAADAASGAPTVLVNEAFEQFYWPDGAIGKRIVVGEDAPAEVVGVVRNAKYSSLGESPAQMRLWQSHETDSFSDMHLLVRVDGDTSAFIPTLRRLVREADPDLPVLEPRILQDVVAQSGQEQQVVSVMLSVIGAVALMLAVVGIYGVVSFLVSRRTREVGLRVALGAQRGDVIGMVVRQGMRLVAAGAVVGLLLAFGISQALAAAFPGVEPLDLVAPALATLLLVVAAAGAMLAPAVRASRVDPMVALRSE